MIYATVMAFLACFALEHFIPQNLIVIISMTCSKHGRLQIFNCISLVHEFRHPPLPAGFVPNNVPPELGKGHGEEDERDACWTICNMTLVFPVSDLYGKACHDRLRNDAGRVVRIVQPCLAHPKHSLVEPGWTWCSNPRRMGVGGTPPGCSVRGSQSAQTRPKWTF